MPFLWLPMAHQQTEGGTVDANWMLVIDDSTDVIAADFEDMATGANHPVAGRYADHR